MMKKAKFIVDNIKCHGCTNSIQKRLKKLKGINSAEIDIEKGAIEVNYQGNLDKNEVKNILSKMGYPEKGTSNNFQKAKSFVSCAVGRIS